MFSVFSFSILPDRDHPSFFSVETAKAQTVKKIVGVRGPQLPEAKFASGDMCGASESLAAQGFLCRKYRRRVYEQVLSVTFKKVAQATF